jgi:predicted nucleic acid-binding protein
MTYLADTSFVFAMADKDDRNHWAARGFYLTTEELMLLPIPVLPE